MSSDTNTPVLGPQGDTISIRSADDTDRVTFIFAEPIKMPEDSPYSPTSSLKATFVRSRPTSTLYSSGTEGTGDINGTGTLSIAAAWAAAEASATWTHVQRTRAETQGISQDDDGARSLFAASTFTTRSRSTVIPVRIVRRADADADAVKDTVDDNATPSIRRRTWPAVKRLRKTVSSIFTRKDAKLKPSVSSNPAPPKPRRVTVSGADRASQSLMNRAASSRNAQKHFAPSSGSHMNEIRRLRRSASFAGFTLALGDIDDAEGDDMDEIAAEARGIVEGIGRRWVFEEVTEGEDHGVAWDDMSVFERDVEH